MVRYRFAGMASIVGLALSSTGCSLVFVHGPPSGHESMPAFACTESTVLPVLDAVGTAGSLVAAATARDDDPDEDRGYLVPVLSAQQNVAANLGLAAALGVSAWVGFRRVAACREAQEALRARLGTEASYLSTKAFSVSGVTTLPGPDQRGGRSDKQLLLSR